MTTLLLATNWQGALATLDGDTLVLAAFDDTEAPSSAPATLADLSGEISTDDAPDYERATFTAEWDDVDNRLRIAPADQWPTLDLLGGTVGAFRVFTDCLSFSINILGHEDQALAHQFSRRGDRIIPQDQLMRMETGAPILAAAVASLDCRTRSHDRVGDHEVIFGDVAAYRAAPAGDALGYFRGRYVKLSLG